MRGLRPLLACLSMENQRTQNLENTNVVREDKRRKKKIKSLTQVL